LTATARPADSRDSTWACGARRTLRLRRSREDPLVVMGPAFVDEDGLVLALAHDRIHSADAAGRRPRTHARCSASGARRPAGPLGAWCIAWRCGRGRRGGTAAALRARRLAGRGRVLAPLHDV